MTIFFVVVVGFFVLLFGYAMVTAVVHRDPRPRSRRSGSFDDLESPPTLPIPASRQSTVAIPTAAVTTAAAPSTDAR
ncbi:hypothetical protein ACWDUL_10765 [Nocardia niigatensis]